MRRTKAACRDSPDALENLDACYVLESNVIPARYRLRTMKEYSALVASAAEPAQEVGSDVSHFRAESDRWWDRQCALLASVRSSLRVHQGRPTAGALPAVGPHPLRPGQARVIPPDLEALETVWESSVTEQEVIRAA